MSNEGRQNGDQAEEGFFQRYKKYIVGFVAGFIVCYLALGVYQDYQERMAQQRAVKELKRFFLVD